VTEARAGRLDQFVTAALGPEYSRAQVARMIKAGLVTVNHAPARAATLLRADDLIEIAEAPVLPDDRSPAAAPVLDIIYEDDELIGVNKPAGLTVHQAPGHRHGTLVDGLLARFPELAAMREPDGVMRPGIVHRLDKDTSGVMVVARTPFARMALSQQFKDRTVRKYYIAIARGVIKQDELVVWRPIGRHPVDRKRMSVNARVAREAVSRVSVLHRFKDATLVGVRPETGRTHQIRVHLASIGHPCLGDAVYGGKSAAAEGLMRQALHALRLEIAHPRTAQRIELTAPLAQDLSSWLAEHGVNVGGLLDPHVAPLSMRF